MSEFAKTTMPGKGVLSVGKSYLHISVSDVAYTILCYIMSGCEFFGGMLPFGLSAYGANFAGGKWPICFLSCVLGMFSAGLGAETFVYIGALAMSTFFMGLVFNNPRFRGICPAISLLATRLCFLIFNGFYGYDILLAVIESVTVWVGVRVFETAVPLVINARERNCVFDTEIVAVYVFFALVVKYASDIPLVMGMDISVICAIVLLLIINLDGDVSSGAAMGIVFGIVAGGKSDSVTSSIGAFALASFGAGMLKRYGKWGVVLGFVTVNTALVAFVPDDIIAFDIFEIAVAALLFAILPGSVTSYISGLNAKTVHAATKSYIEQNKVQRIVCKRLMRLSGSFQTLAQTYADCFENKNMSGKYIINMLDTASAKICPGCGLKYNCWERGYKDSYRAMLVMLETADEKGHIEPCDVPDILAQKCIKLDEFVASFNRMYEIYKVERIWQNRLNESRMLVSGQLDAVSKSIAVLANEIDMCIDVAAEKELKMQLDKAGYKIEDLTFLKDKGRGFKAEILTDKWNVSRKEEMEIASVIESITGVRAKCTSKDHTAEGVALSYRPEAGYAVSVGSAAIPRSNEETSGDSFVTLETNTGEFVAAISDGMGTGQRASVESVAATDLLCNFIHAGVKISTALELINSALLLRSSGESFATMDVCAVRLSDGCLIMYKNGAASGYIITDKGAIRVDSDSLPFGVVESYGEIKSEVYTVDKSAVVVMMSDGALDALTAENENCVVDTVRNMDTVNPQLIASTLLNMAVDNSGGKASDDMTVLVINIYRQK